MPSPPGQRRQLARPGPPACHAMRAPPGGSPPIPEQRRLRACWTSRRALAGSSLFSRSRVGRVELHRQCSERVSEDIVDLVSDAVALGQGGRSIPFGVSPDAVSEELLGLIGPLPCWCRLAPTMSPTTTDRRLPSATITPGAPRANVAPPQPPQSRQHPLPTAGSPSKAIPPPSPATAMKTIEIGANGGEGPT